MEKIRAIGLLSVDWLSLLNLTGQILLQEDITISNRQIEKTISIEDLANDIYFMSVETENAVIIRKVIKQD